MRYVILILFLSYSVIIYGQSDAIENVKLYFRFDKDVFEREYMNNSQAILSIEKIFSKANEVALIDSISIIAYASPEGNKAYNENLAYRRANGIKRYILLHHPAFDSTLIHVYSKGEDWDGLIRLVESSQDISSKEQVLSILKSEYSIDREYSLKKIDNGQLWKYIEKNYLPKLRVGATFLVYYNPEKLKILSSIKSMPPCLDLSKHPEVILPELEINDLQEIRCKGLRKPVLAVKTNLLADVLTSINVELEIPIKERWSVGAEWMFPWWIFDNNKYYNQLLLGTVEGRFWFHTRKQPEVLSGHALGLYVSAGYFDFQWKKNGYQGEIVPSVGLSYTYAHKIGQHFRMEYSAGLGMANIKYRKYTANDRYDQFPWLSSGRTLWLGPTKAEVSFVWLISKRLRNER